jgi:hypothetical protein
LVLRLPAVTHAEDMSLVKAFALAGGAVVAATAALAATAMEPDGAPDLDRAAALEEDPGPDGTWCERDDLLTRLTSSPVLASA